MQKIFVDKNESAALVLKHIKASPEEVVMLVIPTESKLKTLAGMKSLKKKAGEAGKSIVIESVDEKILSLANEANMEAVHPFLSNRNTRSLADIIVMPRSKASQRRKAVSRKKPPYILHVKGSGEKNIPIPIKKKGRYEENSRNWHLRYLIPAAAAFLIILGGLAFNVFFTRAEIVINLERTEWELNKNFTASTSVSREGGAAFIVPGQLLKQQKNMAQLFPATGKGQVAQKATTKITIYNAYGTEPQTLVAKTRFITPDGKLFRLDSEVVVPGAIMQDGKIVPSSIKASATADQAGPAYNIGPIQRMSIPGFKGTPKYEGFYGSMEEVARGGYIGERAIATDSDVNQAKERATEIFRSAFENTFIASPPEGLKLVDGASELRILKINVDKNTNEEGNFSVLGEAEFRSLAFREDDLKKLILKQAQADYPDTKFESLFITYGEAVPNFNDGQMTFAVKAKGVLIPDFDTEKFKSDVLGRSERDVQSIIFEIPHLADAKISLMPFWIKRIPENKNRVTIVVK